MGEDARAVREQRARLGLGQPAERARGEAGEAGVRVGVPGRHEHRDRIGAEAARDEAQHGGRLGVQPLRVVDDDDQRALRRRGRQQGEDRESDEEVVRRRRGGDPEHRVESVPLWSGKRRGTRQQREDELVQPGERHPALALDAGHLQDRERCRLLRRVPEQAALADTRVALQDQTPAVTGPDGGQHRVDGVPFRDAADEHEGLLGDPVRSA